MIVHGRARDTVPPAAAVLAELDPCEAIPADLASAEEVEPTSILQRSERPDEVARVAVFLASDAARVVEGAAWRAEGGIIRSTL